MSLYHYSQQADKTYPRLPIWSISIYGFCGTLHQCFASYVTTLWCKDSRRSGGYGYSSEMETWLVVKVLEMKQTCFKIETECIPTQSPSLEFGKIIRFQSSIPLNRLGGGILNND